MTYREIGAEVGVSQTAVWLVLKDDPECDRRRSRVVGAPMIPGLLPVWRGRTVIDFARVDLDDWERYCHLRFGLHGGGDGYAIACVDGRNIYLHHMLMGEKPRSGGLVVDHVNHDTLDNRRANLRAVTQRENCANRMVKS